MNLNKLVIKFTRGSICLSKKHLDCFVLGEGWSPTAGVFKVLFQRFRLNILASYI